jgi:hypothetical protein
MFKFLGFDPVTGLARFLSEDGREIKVDHTQSPSAQQAIADAQRIMPRQTVPTMPNASAPRALPPNTWLAPQPPPTPYPNDGGAGQPTLSGEPLTPRRRRSR